MSKSRTETNEVITSCYSFEIKKQEGVINLAFADFVGGKVARSYPPKRIQISDYENDPRYGSTLELLQEIADEQNDFEEKRLEALALKAAEEVRLDEESRLATEAELEEPLK